MNSILTCNPVSIHGFSHLYVFWHLSHSQGRKKTFSHLETWSRCYSDAFSEDFLQVPVLSAIHSYINKILVTRKISKSTLKSYLRHKYLSFSPMNKETKSCCFFIAVNITCFSLHTCIVKRSLTISSANSVALLSLRNSNL